MQVRDIKRLLDVLGETDVRELTLETGEYKLTVKRGSEPAALLQPAALTGVAGLGGQGAGQVQAPAQPAGPQPTAAGQDAAVPAAAAAASVDDRTVDVVAPIVGTFYSSPSPESPPYVSVGEKVKPGAVLCIIEAMKLMNEIEAEVAGTVREILVENDEPVEYGQVLFRIEPD